MIADLVRNDDIKYCWIHEFFQHIVGLLKHSTSKAKIHHRTVIVTAAVYWSLYPRLPTYVVHQRYLTYQHWAGVSPYTLAFAFAGTCVLDKQLQCTL